MRSKHQHMLQDPGAPGARAPARRARSASAAAACSAAAASPARQRRSSAATCRALVAQTFRSSLHRAWACLPGCRRARVWRVWRVWRVPDLHFTGRPARAASARRRLRTWRLPAGCKPGRQAMQRGPGSGTNKHGAGPRRRPALVGMRDRARHAGQGGAGARAPGWGRRACPEFSPQPYAGPAPARPCPPAAPPTRPACARARSPRARAPPARRAAAPPARAPRRRRTAGRAARPCPRPFGTDAPQQGTAGGTGGRRQQRRPAPPAAARSA